MDDETKVTIKVGDRALRVREGKPLLNELQNAGVVVSTSCQGQGTCFLCRVKVLDAGDRLNKPTRPEHDGLGNVRLAAGYRLSCQISPVEGLVIEQPNLRRSKKGR